MKRRWPLRYIFPEPNRTALMLRFGVGHITAHLHIRPNEKTIEGAFVLSASVSVTGEIFGRAWRIQNVLARSETWGLCARLFADKGGESL